MQAKYCLSTLFVSIVGCGGGGEKAQPSRSPVALDERPVVLFVGTSLTAAYGLDPEAGFPAILQRKIDSAGLGYRTVNAGVSGETSAGALRRIDWLLEQYRPDVLVLETGANDGLRGQDPDTLQANLEAIITRAGVQQPAPTVLLLAMEALPNLGQRYARRFREVYPAVAEATGVILVPFFLAEVAGVDSLNQPDGIHPTARGQALAAERVWAALGPVLQGAAGPDLRASPSS